MVIYRPQLKCIMEYLIIRDPEIKKELKLLLIFTPSFYEKISLFNYFIIRQAVKSHWITFSYSISQRFPWTTSVWVWCHDFLCDGRGANNWAVDICVSWCSSRLVWVYTVIVSWSSYVMTALLTWVFICILVESLVVF